MDSTLESVSTDATMLWKIATHQHGLSPINQFPKEPDNVVCRLTIKTGSRFVQEEESRFGDQLDSQSDSFALLDTQTRTRNFDR